MRIEKIIIIKKESNMLLNNISNEIILFKYGYASKISFAAYLFLFIGDISTDIQFRAEQFEIKSKIIRRIFNFLIKPINSIANRHREILSISELIESFQLQHEEDEIRRRLFPN